MENVTSDMVINAIKTIRVPALPGEYDIHALIETALNEAGIQFAHEYKLGPRCRVDIMCEGVAVEVKKGRPDARALREQLIRYMAHAEVREMVVVTQRRVILPDTISGKPVHLVALNMLWGVALP